MRTHFIGLTLLAFCGAVLLWSTKLLLEGRRGDVLILTAFFFVVIAVLGLIVAFVPAVARAISDD